MAEFLFPRFALTSAQIAHWLASAPVALIVTHGPAAPCAGTFPFVTVISSMTLVPCRSWSLHVMHRPLKEPMPWKTSLAWRAWALGFARIVLFVVLSSSPPGVAVT